MPPVKSIVLVTIQLSTMGGILLTAPWIAHKPAWLALEIIGCALGAWAVLTMRLDNLRILPEPGASHRLVTSGPYRWIRHPMYTAVLLSFGALAADFFTWPRAAIWIAMALIHVLKLTREERLMLARFPAYAGYAQRTKRLIPLVW